MKKNLSDFELIQKFKNGEQSCFEELIRRYKNKVYAYIGMYIHDQALAEDIFQDTFLKVIQSLKSGKYSDDGRFLSWVIRISHNLIIDHFRRLKQLNVILNDDYESDLFNSKSLADENVEENMVKVQIRKDVRKLVNQLPEDQREVVIMRHYTGLSFKEIADITGVSINTALGRMRYALINIRKMMQEKQITLTFY
ncbi:MAG TPA: sigma-70 family RNA polymerase sigma factor [Bacteroidales bacterium]|nr:sigma-70 family RNA polymerase sigma factor [Bacteroidales bacterium]HQG51896.1 sigma-70 family RNA polymerase sigma factor [Bacteroidales bacterium]HQJ19591.1 sigma-70 family RNA polymerase sigma factor [Bacteroidales bacterium]HRC90199.1 sigma-70 family RNA polymerase sigma factor [Bacteroidales bacterium]